MRLSWEEKITEELKKMERVTGENDVFNRVWFKIEDSWLNRQKHFWKSIIWKPWGHPGGWVTLAACLCLTFTGVLYQKNQADNNDLASFLMTISNPTANINRDLGVLKVPILLTEPSNATNEVLLSDEDHSDLLSGDEILL